MRALPTITDQEYFVPEGVSLVSATDLKGRITYCNSVFIEVSGYSSEELLGRPHSIVRHPDMPKEAFRDLWATIQSGHPWQGTVKNRRKNGDHYWVSANVTPMRDGDRILGYLSVRSKPTSNAILSSASLYAKLRLVPEGRRLPFRIEGGVVHANDGLARSLELVSRAFQGGAFGPLVLCGLGVAAVGWALGSLAALLAVPAGALLGAAVMRHRLGRAADTLIEDAHRLAAGDLTTRVHVDPGSPLEDVQRALAQVSANLKATVFDARHGLERLEEIVASVSKGNIQLSQRSVIQAEGLKSATEALSRLTEATHRDVAEARSGAILASSTADLTRAGHEAAQSVAIAMDAIVYSSNEINAFVQIIDEVASKTQLLAVNASVEAARAGAVGQGFAVVATETRALAHQVQESALQIRRLIERSGDRIRTGEQSAATSIVSVTTAMEQILQVRDMLGNMLDNTAHHERDIDAVNRQVDHLTHLTQQNEVMTTELSVAAQEMKERLDQLAQSMRVFRLHRDDRMVCEPGARSPRTSGTSRSP